MSSNVFHENFSNIPLSLVEKTMVIKQQDLKLDDYLTIFNEICQ